jgi:hypothetical protein
LRYGKQGQIENPLADFRLPPMDEVGQIGNPDRIDLLAGKKNIQNGIHGMFRG